MFLGLIDGLGLRLQFFNGERLAERQASSLL